MSHLRHSGESFAEQCAALQTIVRAEPVLMAVLAGARDLKLADSWLVSGGVYNSVWNALTGRPSMTGVKDIDVAYFNSSDLSYEAEDLVIRALGARFAHLAIPVEPRNQARVHLWFQSRFGFAVPPLHATAEALLRYSARAHAVPVCLEPNNAIGVLAPFGLADVFAFRLAPNRALDNRASYEAKAIRIRATWPEVTILPW